MKIEPNNCYNIDCKIGMELMQQQGLKADWCITDPPYGINAGGVCDMGSISDTGIKRGNYNKKTWDKDRIEKSYFDLIFNISKNQLIFGGNYYTDYLLPTKSWAIWDKRIDNNHRNNFADCEMAWVSTGQARMFRYVFDGMIQGNMKVKDDRFHPTQKPVEMWCQLLNYYTKENDLIVDPFAGSQSLRIACHKLKRRYIGFEIDKEYYDKGCEWFNKFSSQTSMFDLL